MKRFASVRIVRRATCTHVVAAVLIVLAVSPVTAPFSTFDAAELARDLSIHIDASSGGSLSQEVTAGTIGIGAIVPLPLAIVDHTAALTSRIGARQTFSPVLRL